MDSHLPSLCIEREACDNSEMAYFSQLLTHPIGLLLTSLITSTHKGRVYLCLSYLSRLKIKVDGSICADGYCSKHCIWVKSRHQTLGCGHAEIEVGLTYGVGWVENEYNVVIWNISLASWVILTIKEVSHQFLPYLLYRWDGLKHLRPKKFYLHKSFHFVASKSLFFLYSKRLSLQHLW